MSMRAGRWQISRFLLHAHRPPSPQDVKEIDKSLRCDSGQFRRLLERHAAGGALVAAHKKTPRAHASVRRLIFLRSLILPNPQQPAKLSAAEVEKERLHL